MSFRRTGIILSTLAHFGLFNTYRPDDVGFPGPGERVRQGLPHNLRSTANVSSVSHILTMHSVIGRLMSQRFVLLFLAASIGPAVGQPAPAGERPAYLN